MVVLEEKLPPQRLGLILESSIPRCYNLKYLYFREYPDILLPIIQTPLKKWWILLFAFHLYGSVGMSSEWCGMQPHLKVKKVEFSHKAKDLVDTWWCLKPGALWEVMSLPTPHTFILLPAFCLRLSLSARFLSGARRSITICCVETKTVQRRAGLPARAGLLQTTMDQLQGWSTLDTYYAPYYAAFWECGHQSFTRIWQQRCRILIKVEALVDGRWSTMWIFILRWQKANK